MDVLKALLAAGCAFDVDAPDCVGFMRTRLLCAESEDYREMTNSFIAAGADASFAGDEG